MNRSRRITQALATPLAYTAQGTEVLNIYATSDGLPSGDPYFFVHADENDDYVERNVIGDYFLEDYVLFGNPRKDVTLDFTIVESGEYATDYFAHDAGRYTFLFAETTAEIYRIDDQITSLAVEMTATTDTVDWAETVLISFVFFRNPVDTFDMADAQYWRRRETHRYSNSRRCNIKVRCGN